MKNLFVVTFSHNAKHEPSMITCDEGLTFLYVENGLHNPSNRHLKKKVNINMHTRSFRYFLIDLKND